MRRWSVILISPQESGNVGAAARVMKNFGLRDLRIVSPRCDFDGETARAFSSGAAELLRKIQVFQTLQDALKDRELSIAVTGIGGKLHKFDCVGLLPENLLENRKAESKGALVFGREDHGMTGEEMEACDFRWTLPTQKSFPSLNLAQAVAVSIAGLAEASSRLGHLKKPMPTTKSLGTLEGGQGKLDLPANQENIQLLMSHFEELFLKTGWNNDTRTKSSLQKIRNVLARAVISQREANLFHGICKNALYALEQKSED